MKIPVRFISLFLCVVPQMVLGGGAEQRNCQTNELLISLVDYSYCTPKGDINSLNVLGGKHSTVHVIGENYEYSFARMPVSIALVDIPNRKNLSLSLFFKQLADTGYTKDGFTEIRRAFDIGKNTAVSKYSNKSFEAYYIINEKSLNNSIYIYSDSSEYIYVVKGSITEKISKTLLSTLEHIY